MQDEAILLGRLYKTIVFSDFSGSFDFASMTDNKENNFTLGDEKYEERYDALILKNNKFSFDFNFTVSHFPKKKKK